MQSKCMRKARNITPFMMSDDVATDYSPVSQSMTPLTFSFDSPYFVDENSIKTFTRRWQPKYFNESGICLQFLELMAAKITTTQDVVICPRKCSARSQTVPGQCRPRVTHRATTGHRQGRGSQARS